MSFELFQAAWLHNYFWVVVPNATVVSMIIGFWPLLVGGLLQDKTRDAQIGFFLSVVAGSLFFVFPSLVIAIHYGRKMALRASMAAQ